MKNNYSLIFIAFLCFVMSGYGQTTIGIQDFESTPATPTMTYTGGSIATGTGPFPAGDNNFVSGSRAIEESNGTSTVTFASVNASTYSSVYFTCRLASFAGTSGNGADGADEVYVDISTDNGTTWSRELEVQGNNNARWSFDTGTGTATTTYDNDNIATIFTPAGGGNRTTDGYSTIVVDGLPNSTTLRVRLVMNNNSGNEYWIVDDAEILGTIPSGPSITATPTTINNLDYSFGTGPSAPDSFDVTGNLLVAGTTVTSNSTDFQVSLTMVGGYGNSVNVPAGTLNGTTTIYTQLAAGLAVNTYSNTISITNATAGLGTPPTINVNGEVTPAAPSNDDCSGAISLTPTTSCTYTTYTNLNATDSGVADPGCANYTDEDVWFSVLVPATGELTIDTNDIDFTDSGIAVYSGTCGSLTLIECDDDGSANANMSLISRTDFTPGSTIYIRVWEYNGGSVGDFGICVTTPTPCVAPTGQPTGLNLTNITSSSIDGSFTATTADEYLVVVSTSATLSGNPVNGTAYSNGDPLGGGTVVQSSNATTFTASGLSGTTQYYFYVFAYNNSGCAGGPTYNTTSPLTNDATTITGPCLSTGFSDAEGWSNHAYGNWTDTDVNGDVWIGNGIFAGNVADRRIQMNNVNDWLELPPVDNPSSLTYIARLSAAPSGTNSITVQYFNGSTWIDLVVHTSTSTVYELFTADLSGITVLTNVRLRLYRNADDRTHYIDDVNVYCGAPVVGPELQLVDATPTFQNCGYTMDFGNVSTSITSDITFDINNLGNQPLNITSFNITGDYTISPSIATTIAATSSQTFTISFSPGSVGTLNGQLTIASNDADEASCVVNLTGIGFLGTEEIRVETNAGNNIPDGAGIAVVYDNNFGNETEGQTTASKTYLIENLGDGDLDLTTISVSTTEFSITTNPAPLSLAPGESTPLLIAFSPSTPGIKNATVTIINSDADENPFTFALIGNGTCSAGTVTFLPASGPTGTIVTITGTSFGGATTATIKDSNNVDVLMPVTVISATEIEVTIPADAQTSLVEVTNDLGCSATEIFTVFTEDITSCEGNTGTIPAGWTGLMISGLFDNSGGSCHYLELFNPTGSAIVLTGNYEMGLSNNFDNANDNMPVNGSTFTFNGGRQGITGTVPAYSTFMIRFGNTGDTCNDCPSIVPDDTIESGAFGVNGNSGTPLNIDRIFLIQGGTNYVDFWANSDYGSAGFVYTRDLTATAPFVPAEFPGVTYDSAANWDSQGTADCFGFTIPDFSASPTVTVQPSSPLNNCDISYSMSVTATEGFTGGNPLAYQWYYTAPGDTGWTIITNGATYSGSNTNTLNILNAVGLDDYQYYCEVRENTSTCFTASNAARLLVNTSIWFGGAWSFPPANDRIVVIDDNYDTSTGGPNNEISFEACRLIVTATHTLSIENNTFVRVQNNLTVDGNIIVKTDGAFVQVDDAAIVDGDVLTTRNKITVEKETAPLATYREYTYWSSPVIGETIGSGLFESSPNRRFWFNGQNFRDSTQENMNDNTTNPGQDDIDDDVNDWQQITNAATVMAPGVGYAATHNGVGFTPSQYIYTFEGPFNNGVYNIPIYRNDAEGADNNWNFIGNPYPSAVNADLFLAANTAIDQNAGTVAINGAIFFWSHNTVADDQVNGNEVQNYSQSDYAIINGTGETAGGDMVQPNRFIPSGQGFFVSMDDGAASTLVGGSIRTTDVIFNNSMRVIDNNAQFFRNSINSVPNKIRLNLTSDNGVFNQILVGYVDGATDEDDGMYYDAHKNLSANANAIIYSVLETSDDKKFAIQGKDPIGLTIEEVIPLGFFTIIDEATIYTLSVAQLEGEFMNENTVYLKDMLLDAIHELSESDYTFTSETGVFNNRFEIVFQPQSLSVTENEVSPNDVSIVELGDGDVKVSVGNSLVIKHVEIIDVVGRTIYKLKGNNNVEVYNLSRLSQAAYIARITLSNGQIITKKAIKRK